MSLLANVTNGPNSHGDLTTRSPLFNHFVHQQTVTKCIHLSDCNNTSERPTNVTLTFRTSSPLTNTAVPSVHIMTKIPKETVHLRSAPPWAIRAALRYERRVVKRSENTEKFRSSTTRTRVPALCAGKLPPAHQSPAWPLDLFRQKTKVASTSTNCQLWFRHKTKVGSVFAPLRSPHMNKERRLANHSVLPEASVSPAELLAQVASIAGIIVLIVQTRSWCSLVPLLLSLPEKRLAQLPPSSFSPYFVSNFRLYPKLPITSCSVHYAKKLVLDFTLASAFALAFVPAFGFGAACYSRGPRDRVASFLLLSTGSLAVVPVSASSPQALWLWLRHCFLQRHFCGKLQLR